MRSIDGYVFTTYVPTQRNKPVNAPIYTPMPRDRPVEVPIVRVKPTDDRMCDPVIGEWPVEDRVCEAKTLLRPTGGQMERTTPLETQVFKPIPREKPYGLRPREKEVEVPKLKGRPVDGWEYEPLYKVRPADYKVRTAMPEERTEYTQDPMGKPVSTRTQKPRSEAAPDNDETYEPIPRKGPIAILGSVIGPVKPMRYDVTPRNAAEDNRSNKKTTD